MASSKRRPAITYILILYETLLHIGSTNQTTPRAHRKRRLNRTIHHPKPQVNSKYVAKDTIIQGFVGKEAIIDSEICRKRSCTNAVVEGTYPNLCCVDSRKVRLTRFS